MRCQSSPSNIGWLLNLNTTRICFMNNFIPHRITIGCRSYSTSFPLVSLEEDNPIPDDFPSAGFAGDFFILK